MLFVSAILGKALEFGRFYLMFLTGSECALGNAHPEQLAGAQIYS